MKIISRFVLGLFLSIYRSSGQYNNVKDLIYLQNEANGHLVAALALQDRIKGLGSNSASLDLGQRIEHQGGLTSEIESIGHSGGGLGVTGSGQGLNRFRVTGTTGIGVEGLNDGVTGIGLREFNGGIVGGGLNRLRLQDHGFFGGINGLQSSNVGGFGEQPSDLGLNGGLKGISALRGGLDEGGPGAPGPGTIGSDLRVGFGGAGISETALVGLGGTGQESDGFGIGSAGLGGTGQGGFGIGGTGLRVAGQEGFILGGTGLGGTGLRGAGHGHGGFGLGSPGQGDAGFGGAGQGSFGLGGAGLGGAGLGEASQGSFGLGGTGLGGAGLGGTGQGGFRLAGVGLNGAGLGGVGLGGTGLSGAGPGGFGFGGAGLSSAGLGGVGQGSVGLGQSYGGLGGSGLIGAGFSGAGLGDNRLSGNTQNKNGLENTELKAGTNLGGAGINRVIFGGFSLGSAGLLGEEHEGTRLGAGGFNQAEFLGSGLESENLVAGFNNARLKGANLGVSRLVGSQNGGNGFVGEGLGGELGFGVGALGGSGLGGSALVGTDASTGSLKGDEFSEAELENLRGIDLGGAGHLGASGQGDGKFALSDLHADRLNGQSGYDAGKTGSFTAADFGAVEFTDLAGIEDKQKIKQGDYTKLDHTSNSEVLDFFSIDKDSHKDQKLTQRLQTFKEKPIRSPTEDLQPQVLITSYEPPIYGRKEFLISGHQNFNIGLGEHRK